MFLSEWNARRTVSFRWAHKSFILSRIINMHCIRCDQYILTTYGKSRKFLKVTMFMSNRDLQGGQYAHRSLRWAHKRFMLK